MKKLIKNANDFVLAVLMLALSLFLLLYPNITSNIPSVSMGGYFTRRMCISGCWRCFWQQPHLRC